MAKRKKAKQEGERPWKLYERILTIKHLHPEWSSDKVVKAVGDQLREAGFIGAKSNPGRGRTIAKEKKSELVKLESGQEDGKDFNFEEKFLTRRGLKKFAIEKHIPFPAIEELIEDGRLKPKRFPGYAYKKYSTRQLGILLRQYNTY